MTGGRVAGPRRPVIRRARAGVAAVCAALLVTACAESPLGHRQLKLLPEDQLQRMGAVAYDRIREDTPVLQDPGVRRYVRCITSRVTAGDGRQWQVTVFADDTPNAFALPGGRIGIHSGMLDVARNQHQLAAVIAHEVAHVRADHPNARLSAAYAAEAATELVAAVASGEGVSRDVLGLLGAGVQYGVVMPYGRSQETEADVLGLRYMAEAGFDPRESIDLWRNMARAGGGGPPAFLSTHPSHGSRIDTLKERMPAAMERYRAARQQGRDPDCG